MPTVTDAFSGAIAASLACFEQAELPAGQPLISAVSGGPDSLALAIIMQKIATMTGRHHQAVIINHGLRIGARAEAEQTHAQLTSMGIAAEIRDVTASKPATGLQEFARRHRLSLLAEAGRATDGVVCFGHHQFDQAETVLMRLLKDSGLVGLAGMPPHRWHEGCLFLRPFLHLQPEALRAICDLAGAGVIHDPSNDDGRFERVRMRQYLRGQPDLTPKLLRLSRQSAAIMAALDTRLAHAFAGDIQLAPPYAVSVCFDKYRALPQPARHRLLVLLLQQVGDRQHPPARAAIGRLDQTLMTPSDGGATLAGCSIKRRAQRLLIATEARHLPQPVILTDAQGGQVFDNRWLLYGHSVLGQPGWQVAPLGKARYDELPRASALRDHLSRWPYPSRLRFPVLIPLDDSAHNHHLNSMVWAPSLNGLPSGLPDGFSVELLRQGGQFISKQEFGV